MLMIKTTNAITGETMLFNQQYIIMAEETEDGRTKVTVDGVGCFFVKERFDCLVKPLGGKQDAAD